MLGDSSEGADGGDGWPARLDVLPRWVRVGGPATAVVAVLVVVGAGWRITRSQHEPESPGEVVAEFFHAQRAGDCERLIDVVARKSWAAGGERSRAEFLDQCNEVLGGDAPVGVYDALLPDGVQITVEGNEAEVTAGGVRDYVARHGLDRDYALAGTLVRQDGEWKVEVSEGLLRIGPSAWGTVRAFFEAYADRECDRLGAYVTEDASLPLQTRCQELSQDPLESSVAGAVRVAFDGDSEATATVLTTAPALGPATLVKEGLSWKVASFPILLDDLRTKLVDEVMVDGQPCFEWNDFTDDDMAAPFGDVEPQASVRREFTDDQRRADGRTCHFALSIHAFGSEAEAQEAAGGREVSSNRAFMAHGRFVVEVELTEDDLEEYGSTDAAAIATAQVDAL